MVFSILSAALLGLVALSQAHPVAVYNKNEISQAQLEQLFAVGQESFLRSLPSGTLHEVSRTLETPSAPQACEDVFLIFARGTFEPASDKNLGIMVGNFLSSALKAALGSRFDSIGVDYNNSVAGYLSGGDSAGGVTMAGMITAKANACPNTKIIASGYSQGAQVTHNALGQVRGTAKTHVAAVVVFGDPNKGKSIPGIRSDQIYTNCASDDPICMGIPLPLGSHLTYGSNTAELQKIVTFVQSKVGSGK